MTTVLSANGVPASELARRGLAAFYRAGVPEAGGLHFDADLVRVEGLDYVRVMGAGRVMAVYRVTNQGQLRRLRRWPRGLE